MSNQRQGQEQPQPQNAVRQRHIHLNWSNFKPEFSGKPEEDAEAHLLCSNDWMEADCFDEDIRVQGFCLTLLGTIDYYVIIIRQVTNLLGYGEPQILEVFKNTLPTKLYWILFPIEDPRQAVDTAKRILTKEKLDRQLTGQMSTSPFMSIREGTDKRVSFDTRDKLGDKIDKLTVIMSKLVATDNHERRPFKPQLYKSRGQNRSYGQGTYQPRSTDRNRGYDADSHIRQNYWGSRSRGNFRGNRRQSSREDYRSERYGNNNNRDRNRSRQRTFTGNYRRDRSSSNDRSRSGSRASTNRDRIRCYTCREYDHFARNCPNSREERDLEQLQHMLNMEEQDHRSLSTHSSDEDCRSPLNL